MRIPSFLKDESGLATIEWVLLFGFVVLPLAGFMFKVLEAVGAFYTTTSWVISLPFP